MTVGILVDVFSDEHQLLSVEIQPGTRQLGMIGGMCGRFVEYASPLARWGVIMIEALCELFFLIPRLLSLGLGPLLDSTCGVR